MTGSASGATKARSAPAGRGWVVRNSAVLIMAALAVFVLAGLAVHPVRTWLSQREQLAETEAELTEVKTEVAELENQLELLETDQEVERRARRDFYLVYPGEESYRILPSEQDAPGTTVTQPDPGRPTGEQTP